ncbi:hypothetical protein OSB04_028325 [Centaurea solstitialis]|uniref:Uncharacterized protein n=1 Tax=Centaurea solstitialis TaxID=347529 RepID=A0AA38W951_9ASTR|nr:hypothetical protein OSB04_028325 [Centaurea solstitialis]
MPRATQCPEPCAPNPVPRTLCPEPCAPNPEPRKPEPLCGSVWALKNHPRPAPIPELKGIALKNLEIMYCRRLKSIEISDSNIVSFNFRIFYSQAPISYRFENLEKLEKISIHDSK